MGLAVRIITALALTGLCAACEDAATKAEKQYAIVQSSGGTNADLCEAGNKVAAAYLARQDSARYSEWKIRANLYCLRRDQGVVY